MHLFLTFINLYNSEIDSFNKKKKERKKFIFYLKSWYEANPMVTYRHFNYYVNPCKDLFVRNADENSQSFKNFFLGVKYMCFYL